MANKKYPEFQYEICVACGVCAQACPVSAIRLERNDLNKFKDAFPSLEGSKCIGCGICNQNCPVRAISMKERPEAVA